MAIALEPPKKVKQVKDIPGPNMLATDGRPLIKNLRLTVEKLASFPTRNTNTEECRKAELYAQELLSQIPGMEVELQPYQLPEGPRVPQQVTAHNVIATLHGETRKRVIIAAHIDSLNRNGQPFTDIAPGANDDATGVALVLECARLMAQRNWHNTVQFVIFTGEEQGLVGAEALAHLALDQEWDIEAVINVDTVGNSKKPQNEELADRVRVFSQESDLHQSRMLALLMEWLQNTKPESESVRFLSQLPRSRPEELEFKAELILRQDRLGRGGDHMPFNQCGFTAIRLVESQEDFERQHTSDDLPQHVDFDYLSQVTHLALLTMTALADAEPAPTNVKIVRELGEDTQIHWDGQPEQDYNVFVRSTSSAQWQEVITTKGASYTWKSKSKDDYFFAVGAIGGIPVPAQ